MLDAATASTTEPTRSERLLAIVRKVVDYGKELATTIRRRAFNDPASVKSQFGTVDVASILAAISRGLHRANALEARIVRTAARLDAADPAIALPPKPRAARKAVAFAADAPDSRLVHLPTPDEIAAEVRRRPIGAVLADICRDLGIGQSHPLWRDLQHLMIQHGGNPSRLVMSLLDRSLKAILADWPPGMVLKWTPGSVWPEVVDSTRPP